MDVDLRTSSCGTAHRCAVVHARGKYPPSDEPPRRTTAEQLFGEHVD
jgi:hypothetical protein